MVGNTSLSFSVSASFRSYVRSFREGGLWSLQKERWGCSKNRGFSPQIIHFNKVFHYKPSILGYHNFWKHPYGPSKKKDGSAKGCSFQLCQSWMSICCSFWRRTRFFGPQHLGDQVYIHRSY